MLRVKTPVILAIVVALVLAVAPSAGAAGCVGSPSCPYQEVSVIGSDPPVGGGVFRFPQALAFTPGGDWVFVADQHSSVVQKFRRDGTDGAGGAVGTPALVFGWPADRRQLRRLGQIGGLATDRLGHVYVLDSTNERVQVFSSATGDWVGAWGTEGDTCVDGGACYFRFGINGGIAIDQPLGAPLPVAYLVDHNHRVMRFALDANGLPPGAGDPSVPTNIPIPVAQRQWGSFGECNADPDKPAAPPCSGDAFRLALNFPQGVAVNPQPDGQQQRTVYVADDRNHRVVEYTPDGGYVGQVGVYGTGQAQFRFPYDVGVDNHNNLYVADNNNHRVQKFLASTLGFEKMWGIEGPFTSASFTRGLAALADDPQGGVYVADTANNEVEGFDVEGTKKVAWGRDGRGAGYFTRPSGVAADAAGNAYVADTLHDRIQKLDPAGRYVAQWCRVSGSTRHCAFGTAEGEFDSPHGVAFDESTGHVWVADTGNHRVQELTSDGSPEAVYGGTSAGTSVGRFNAPRGIAVDGAGNVYVADTRNHRIQRFDAATRSWSVLAGGTRGSTLGQFDSPGAVTVSPSGATVYVADSNNNRLQRYDGTWSAVAPPAGSAFDHPAGVHADGGWLYVSDTGASRVLRLDPGGSWETIGGEGPTLGSFVNPAGLVTADGGNVLLVADTANNRVQRLRFKAAADFALSVTPTSQTIRVEQTASYTVSISPSGGFADPIDLSVSGQPAGPAPTLQPDPASRSADGSYPPSTLQVYTSKADTKPGNYALTITGTGTSTGGTHSTTATLQVKRK